MLTGGGAAAPVPSVSGAATNCATRVESVSSHEALTFSTTHTQIATNERSPYTAMTRAAAAYSQPATRIALQGALTELRREQRRKFVPQLLVHG